MGFRKIALVVSALGIEVALSGLMAYAAVQEAHGEAGKGAVAIGVAAVGAAIAWWVLRLRGGSGSKKPVGTGGAIAVVIGAVVAAAGGWAALIFTSLLCGFFAGLALWMIPRVPVVLRDH